MEESVKTGLPNLHMNMVIHQQRILKLDWDQTSAETQMASKQQSGAIHLIQTKDGSIVSKWRLRMLKVYGVTKEMIIEECKQWLDLEEHVKHGKIKHLIHIFTSQKNIETVNLFLITVEIQQVLKKQSGAIQLMLSRGENSVIQYMWPEKNQVKKQLMKMVGTI